MMLLKICFALAPECGCQGITVKITNNMGFSSELTLQCSNPACTYTSNMHTSPRAEGGKHAYTINAAMTLLAHELSIDHIGLNKMARVLGMPNMHLNSYQQHDKKALAAEIDAGKCCLQSAALKIRAAYSDTSAEDDEPEVIDICVSCDGTWMKLGFSPASS